MKTQKSVFARAQDLHQTALNLETIRFWNASGTFLMPGALTATEMIAAWNAGAHFVEFFLAAAVGAQAI